MNAIDESIGFNLARARERSGLSKLQLAMALDVTAERLGAFEHGRERVDATTLYKISALLAIPIAALFLPRQAATQSVGKDPDNDDEIADVD